MNTMFYIGCAILVFIAGIIIYSMYAQWELRMLQKKYEVLKQSQTIQKEMLEIVKNLGEECKRKEVIIRIHSGESRKVECSIGEEK